MDIQKQKQELIAEVESKLPVFAKAVHDAQSDEILLHQDAFAGDYQDEEYSLLGKAVKYAGLFGKVVTIHGLNRETIKGVAF